MAEPIVESSTEAVLNVARTERIRVLHVDDDQAFVKVAKQCLEMQGPFQVDMASSVEEAWEKMKKEAYDVVVSDYQMPGKDGLQFLEELRRKGNSIPFIVFTGKGREEVVIKALNMGADHYENKNGDPETVYSELSHDIIGAVRTRRAEQELRIQREELQVILDSMPAKIWYKDRNNRLVRVNKAFAEYMGVSKENLEGKPLCDLFPPDIAQKCWEEDKEVITTGQPKTDILDRHESAQGVRWFSTGKVPCREKDGKIIGTINFSVDITERKKAEEELRRSEARFRALVEPNIIGILSADMNHIIDANDAFLKIVGYTRDDLAQGKLLWREMTPAEYHASDERGLEEMLAKGSCTPFEKEYFRKDGSRVPILIGAALLQSSPLQWICFVMDITERKKAEEALRESEIKFRRIFENAGDGLISLDFSGRILDANGEALRIFGGSREEVLGKRFTKVGVFSLKEIPTMMRGFSDVLRGKHAIPKVTIKNKNGQMISLECSASLLKVNGKSTITVVARDVSEREKAEDRLRESEERHRTLFQAMRDGVIVKSPDGKILSANPAAAALLGYERPEELVGKSAGEFYADKNQRKAVLEDLMKKGHVEDLELALKKKDGTHIYVSSSIASHSDKSGNILQTGFFRDITERKRMEEEVKSSERKFRGLVEDSASAIATIDLKGRLTYANEALADLFGYSVQEISGRAFKDFVHPDDRGNLVRLFLKIIVLRRQPRKFEFRALRKDGAILHFMCRPTRLETAGKTVGFQAILIDNTAEKRMLEKAEKLNEKLSVVGGLTRHDVNSKLSTILNVSYLLKQRLPDDQSLELVKETESAVHQIVGLFEFARTYEKLGTEELASVDVEKVFNEAAMLFPSLKDMKIVNDCHGLTVFADSLLRQLFYNLIDNSLKHGEKVSQVRVHYQTHEDHLKLIYEDDGIGIPKAEKDKIFKEGYGKARGHGLYLIKKMCEVYDWTIQETGKQGTGAQFTMSIPRKSSTGKGARGFSLPE